MIELARFQSGSASDRAKVARALDRAFRELGFLALADHGVSPATMAAAREVTHEFFALPARRKSEVRRPRPGVLRGWLPMGHESLARSLGRAAPIDLNESFQIGPLAARDNLWPAHPRAFREAWSKYYRAMERVARDLMRVSALSLGLPIEFFDDKFRGHSSRLRARYYPPQTKPPLPKQLRAGAHTDYVSLAILDAEPGVRGLQIRGPNRAWIDVPIDGETFIVNVGDLLARWTNDRWQSTLHRVVNPMRSVAHDGRLSLVFFHSPANETRIECLDVCCRERAARYRPIRAGDWLAEKFRKAELETL